MLTKAEIQNIDFNSNSCQVRLPIFENAGLKEKAIATAYFAITPGEYNSYKVGDIVIVGFDCNEWSKPYILGKLFTGIASEEENNKHRGTINCDSLSVKQTAALPSNTTINTKQEASDSTDNKNNINTLKDLINTVKQNSNDIAGIEREIETISPNQSQASLLWENPNPTAGFEATTITLNQNYTDFKYIIVFYRYYFSNCVEQYMTFITPIHNGTTVDTHKQAFINGGNYQNDWASRQINFSNAKNQLTIYQAQQVAIAKDSQQEPTGSILVNTSSLFCVPTRIYGKNIL